MAEFNAYLMKGTTAGETTTYSKLVDVRDTPAIHGEAEVIDRTTKSNSQRVYTEGVMANDVKVFRMNYSSTDYTTCAALDGIKTKFAIYIGDTTGSDGKFAFEGIPRTRILESDTGAPYDMEMRIIPTSEVTKLS